MGGATVNRPAGCHVWGKMQVDAQKMHRELTGADAFRGIGRCLFPPLGIAKLMQGK